MNELTFDFEFDEGRRHYARQIQFYATRSEEKAKGNPDRNAVCRYWLEGSCAAGDRCFFSHVYDLDRVPLCAYIDSRCAEGNACKFRHFRHPGERDSAVTSDPLRVTTFG